MELIISFEKDDKELLEALEKQFGENVEYSEGKGFDGLEVLLTAVVPITALTVQIIDFILSNFRNRNNIGKKRMLLDTDGSLDLEGYTDEEVCKILQCYFENQKNDK